MKVKRENIMSVEALEAQLEKATAERLAARYELRDLRNDEQQMKVDVEHKMKIDLDGPAAVLDFAQLYARAIELQLEASERQARKMVLEAAVPLLDHNHLLAQLELALAVEPIERAAKDAAVEVAQAEKAEAEAATARAKSASHEADAAVRRHGSCCENISKVRQGLAALEGSRV